MTQQQTNPLRQFAPLDFSRYMAKILQARDDEGSVPWKQLLNILPVIDLNDTVVSKKDTEDTSASKPLPATYTIKLHNPFTTHTIVEPQHLESSYSKQEEWVEDFFRSYPNPLDIREANRRKLFISDSDEDVLDLLDQNNLHRYIDDYISYSEYRLRNLEDDERPGIILHSLQSWAWFLIDCAKPLNLPYTKISADFHGCVELEWELSGYTRTDDRASKYWGPHEGIAMLRFYPSRMHAFSILSGSYASGKRRTTFESCLPYGELKKILPLFAERFLDDSE